MTPADAGTRHSRARAMVVPDCTVLAAFAQGDTIGLMSIWSDHRQPPRRWRIFGVSAIASMLAVAIPVRADPTADQLKTMYDDAMRQLQQAQERKNQLANENEQQKARIADLEQRLKAADAAVDPNYPSRARKATVEAFLASDMVAAARFDRFNRVEWAWVALESEGEIVAVDWPFRVAPPLPMYVALTTTQATTEPSSAPATSPATNPATEPAMQASVQPTTASTTQAAP